jgi:hypothetical protein
MHRDKRQPCCTARGVLHPDSDIVMDELSERERAVGRRLCRRQILRTLMERSGDKVLRGAGLWTEVA